MCVCVCVCVSDGGVWDEGTTITHWECNITVLNIHITISSICLSDTTVY